MSQNVVPNSAATAEAIMANLPVEEFPHLSLMVEHAFQPDYTYAAEFAWGLDLLLDVLEAARPRY
ncbi:MAG: hypothetical protein VW450_02310 [Chloroflexota bacterium]